MLSLTFRMNMLDLFLARLLVFIICLFAKVCFANSFPDVWDDPMSTIPPRISNGPSFPDSAPIACPSIVNLSIPLGLTEAIDLTLCNNAQLKYAWAGIKNQAAALGEASSAYFPTANFTYSPHQETRVKYPGFSDSNSISRGRMANANITWRIFDFGGQSGGRISAQHLLQSALSTYDANLQKVMAVTVQSYFDTLTAKATSEAKSLGIQLAVATLEATLRRQNNGNFSKSDTLQAQAALAKAQMASSRADGDYRKAQATLIFAMGLPSDTQIILAELTSQINDQNLKDLHSWLDFAEKQHPAIKAARGQLESAKVKIGVARASGLPNFDLVLNYYQNGYPGQGVLTTKQNTTTTGFNIAIPIFDGFSTTYKIRSAQAVAEQADASLHDVSNQILTDIVKSYADVLSSIDNIKSSDSLVAIVTAAEQSAMKRYAAGASDVLEVISTQATLNEAQQERIRCIAEHRSARLRLLANAGSLARLDILKN